MSIKNQFTRQEKALARRIFREISRQYCAMGIGDTCKFGDNNERKQIVWFLVARWHLGNEKH